MAGGYEVNETKIISIRLPKELLQEIDAEAASYGLTRTAFITSVCYGWFDQKRINIYNSVEAAMPWEVVVIPEEENDNGKN